VIGLTLLFNTSASADGPAPATTEPASIAPSSAPLVIPKGLWTFETYGSYASEPTGTREQIYSGTVGLGYYFINNNSLSLEFNGLQGAQPGGDVDGGALNLLLRTDLINEPGFSVLIDFGPGLMETDHRFPASGTDFNFFFKTGVGAQIHLSDRTDLLTGVRYLHISNARMDGPDRNPSINTIEGYLGLIFRL
jgi:hypothetical protein